MAARCLQERKKQPRPRHTVLSGHSTGAGSKFWRLVLLLPSLSAALIPDSFTISLPLSGSHYQYGELPALQGAASWCFQLYRLRYRRTFFRNLLPSEKKASKIRSKRPRASISRLRLHQEKLELAR